MKKLINNLKELKKFGMIGVKQSLEDEGATFKDIELMRKITLKAGVDLNVKIGGCEAKNDIYFCKQIKVNSIVAPMVESEYALKKFIQIAYDPKDKFTNLFVNIETKNALINLRKIINSKYFKFLDGIVFGRSDIAGSYNLQKKDVNSKMIFSKISNALLLLKNKNKLIKMGGSITPTSISFIENFYKKKLLKRVETRNIEIELNKKNIENLNVSINKIFAFEMKWLQYKSKIKSNKKSLIRLRDYRSRINEINNRLKNYKL
jgi:4-hydroxy-2-oxoheptanedioate aldolase